MIRNATPGDIPAMLEIYRPYVEETAYTFEYEPPTLAEFTRRFHAITEKLPWLVWEESGEVLAYCYADLPFSRAAYQWAADMAIYVKQGSHHRGIGRQLYTQVEDILRRQGYFITYALVTTSNEPSCRFHLAQGYHAMAQFPDCGWKQNQWHSVTWFEKRLQNGTPTAAPIGWQEMIET